MISDPTEKAELSHLILSHPDPPNLDAKHKIFHKHIDSKVNILKENTNEDTKIFDMLNSSMQTYEIENCIHDLDEDKAFSPGMIHNQMMINGRESLITHLKSPFNNGLKRSIFLAIWNFSNVCLIPKPGKTHSNPKNFRLIAISSCLGRVFEKVLSKRLQQFCVKHKTFNDNQCGFQINRSTDEILTTFFQDCHNALKMKTSIDCIFTDFSKAYDSI